MSAGLRVRIVSDGRSDGTKVLVDGKPLDTVVTVSWTCTAPGLASATIELVDVEAEVEGELVDAQTFEARKAAANP